jgi:tetratricopeptide (TPR) repeat protein
MNLEKLKDTARKFEQKEDWRRAIEVYLKAVQQIESGQDTSPDLSLYNRVGDLYLKINDTASAVRSYERAVDLYADQGFFNNAIALCGKILRVNPGRTQTYLKLAQLHARKNVVIEAKRNLIEFMERMNALGQLDQAFQSVKEFADQFSGSQEIRMMLVELLRAASREDEAREQLEKLAGELEGRDRPDARRSQEIPQVDLDEAAPARGRGSLAGLVFLDTGVDVPTTPPRAGEVERIIEASPAAESEAPVAPAEGLILPDNVPDVGSDEGVLGLEPAGGMDMGSAELITTSFDDDLGLQPTDEAVPEFGGELLAGIEEPLATVDEEGLLTDEADLMVGLTAEHVVLEPEEDQEDELDLDLVDAETTPSEATTAEAMIGEATTYEVPIDEMTAAETTIAEAKLAETTTFETFTAAATPEAAAESRTSVVGESVSELQDAILDNPDDPALHRRLAEALAAGGDDERALEELELALDAYERGADYLAAAGVADLLVVLAPDVIRHHQKRVELAFRGGEREPLLEAYLSLGDALARAGAGDKAAAVYSRVQEHDPGNERAEAALATLSSVPVVRPPRPAARPAPAAPSPEAASTPPAPPPPPPEPPKVVTPGAAGADFVDFASMVLEEKAPLDTRMRVDRRDPQGDDEQREFQEILEQFKRGIDQNIESDDYQSHYDLGVAFKEMGLLDEAIAEFQKALRSPDGRLRTSEALGICFYDKSQYAISETVLRRAAETVDGGDEAKIGLLYWLGRAAEAQGKTTDAMSAYERALAVDIRFMDLSARMHRLTGGGEE